ncbi:MAG: hypothetical protein JWO80_4464 [Bryobacterales bacterium]|nr:hypothetical protein [Bryobacterales bacterium]
MKDGKQESGFALLLVFAMASIIAISLYMSLPRVAFEAERDKEALLIERGEQYSRAIQLYVRKSKRFPGKIEDLENTNGIRFLRRQYIDPMTGKSEWRLIHAGPGGALIDSLVKKKEKKEAKVVDNFITELSPLGGAQPSDANTNPALRHRPSDQTGAGANPNAGPIPPDPGLVLPAGANAATNTPTNNAANNPANPTVPAVAGTTAPAPGGVPGPAAPAVNQPAQPTAPSSGISSLPSFGAPAQPAQLPAGVAQQINNPNGQPPAGSPAGTPATPTDASKLIQGLLTTPRPGGLAGVQAGQQQQQAQQTIGGGIAGVASPYKGMGIKIYNDQDEFPKWEFVYDVSKDKTMNPAAAMPQAGPAPGTPIGGNPATPQQTQQPGQTGSAFTTTPAPAPPTPTPPPQ